MSEHSKILLERVEEMIMRFEPSIMSIFNKNKKISKVGNREKDLKKRNRYERIGKCPEAPHNTTQYLTNKKKSKDCVSINEEIEGELEKEYTIDNFIITGGSMKGIIQNIMLFN